MSIQLLFHEACPLIIGKNMILNLYGTKSNLQRFIPNLTMGDFPATHSSTLVEQDYKKQKTKMSGVLKEK